MSEIILHYHRKVVSDVREISAPILKTFKVKIFSHLRIWKNGRMATLSTDVPTAEFMLNHHYPMPGCTSQGSFLSAGVHLTDPIIPAAHRDMAKLMAEKFDLGNGLSIVRKHKDYDDVFVFVVSLKDQHMLNYYLNNIDLLNHFTHYYLDKSVKLLSKAHIDIALVSFNQKKEIENLNKNSIPNDNLAIDEFINNLKIKKIILFNNDHDIQLSQREFECLKLCAKNYTMKEMAKILNISPRTVETYLDNIKFKLGCDNKSQLIEVVKSAIF